MRDILILIILFILLVLILNKRTTTPCNMSQPRNEVEYIIKFEAFVSCFQKNFWDMTEAEIARTDDLFMLFSVVWYNDYKEDLDIVEKKLLINYRAKYTRSRAIWHLKDKVENIIDS